MAGHLSKAFGRTPESWLQFQMNYDLAQINPQADRIQVTPLARSEADLMPT